MSSSRTDRYEANLLPRRCKWQASTTPVTAVCLSGSGSRALTCALGQLSALNSLPAPNNPAETLAQPIPIHLFGFRRHLGESVLYTFLPSNVSDSDFLIAPGCSWRTDCGCHGNHGLFTVIMLRHRAPAVQCLGHRRLSGYPLAMGFPSIHSAPTFATGSGLPCGRVGSSSRSDCTTPPYSSNAPYLLPDRFFSLSAPTHRWRNITSENLTLDAVVLLYQPAKPNRPTLIVNTNLLRELLHSRFGRRFLSRRATAPP